MMATVLAQPISRYDTPAYPTRLDVTTAPQLLAAQSPRGWLSNRELMALASALLAANLAGCDGGTARTSRGRLPPDAAAVVAPVFEHGEGRGLTGCVALSPPVFLSEEEALTVIREALAAYGLQLTEREVEVKGVRIPRREETQAIEWVSGTYARRMVEVPGEAQPLMADLFEPRLGIAIEYVSETGCCDLGGPCGRSFNTEYDFKEVAEFVVSHVEDAGHGVYFGIFYDPLTELVFYPPSFYQLDLPVDVSNDHWEKMLEPWSMSWDREERHAAHVSTKLLRLQVKDFVDWLKAQGVI